MLLCELSPERLDDENVLLRKEPVHFDAAAVLVGAVVQQRIRDLIAIQLGKRGTEYMSPLGIARDLARWLKTAGITTQPPGKIAPVILQIVAEKVEANG